MRKYINFGCSFYAKHERQRMMQIELPFDVCCNLKGIGGSRTCHEMTSEIIQNCSLGDLCFRNMHFCGYRPLQSGWLEVKKTSETCRGWQKPMTLAVVPLCRSFVILEGFRKMHPCGDWPLQSGWLEVKKTAETCRGWQTPMTLADAADAGATNLNDFLKYDGNGSQTKCPRYEN